MKSAFFSSHSFSLLVFSSLSLLNYVILNLQALGVAYKGANITQSITHCVWACVSERNKPGEKCTAKTHTIYFIIKTYRGVQCVAPHTQTSPKHIMPFQQKEEGQKEIDRYEFVPMKETSGIFACFGGYFCNYRAQLKRKKTKYRSSGQSVSQRRTASE